MSEFSALFSYISRCRTHRCILRPIFLFSSRRSSLLIYSQSLSFLDLISSIDLFFSSFICSLSLLVESFWASFIFDFIHYFKCCSTMILRSFYISVFFWDQIKASWSFLFCRQLSNRSHSWYSLSALLPSWCPFILSFPGYYSNKLIQFWYWWELHAFY